MSLVEHEVAGAPVTGKRWIQRSVRQLERALARRGMYLPKSLVHRVLDAAGIHPKSNVKRLTPTPHPDRDKQFRYLLAQRQKFEARGDPVISVDTKQKELIGLFAHRGTVWRRRPHEVYSHDFATQAKAKLVPFGIYDVGRNEGFIFAGLSFDTSDFAVDAIVWWWRTFGRKHYPGHTHLLILADSGGANGCRRKRWKYRLQRDLCEALGLTVTVCHYPRGASKWNPVEHRLFSQISQTWRGLPLVSTEVAIAAMRATTTRTGLKVRVKLTENLLPIVWSTRGLCPDRAFRSRGKFTGPWARSTKTSTPRVDQTMGKATEKIYVKGEKVAWWQQEMIQLHEHRTCPRWNYTLTPKKKGNLFWDTS